MKPEDIEVWLSQTGPECDESSGITNVFAARPIDTTTTTTPRRSKRKALPDHSPSSSSAAAAATPKPKKPRTSQPAAAVAVAAPKPEANDTPTTATTLDPKTKRDWSRLPLLEPPSVTTSEQGALDERSKMFMGLIGDWAGHPNARELDLDPVTVSTLYELDRDRTLAAHRRTRRTVG